MRRILATAVLALGLLVPAYAQNYNAPGATQVQQYQTGISGANAQLTVTLPAVTGQFHYLTSLELTHTCTSGVAGSAVITITTTNLNGLQWINGNLCTAGQEHQTLITFTPPFKSAVSGTASTIVFPAMGTSAQSGINVYYYTAP